MSTPVQAAVVRGVDEPLTFENFTLGKTVKAVLTMP